MAAVDADSLRNIARGISVPRVLVVDDEENLRELVELTLVALALGVALVVQPGALRDLALVVVAIGGLSSLLVNANPLMRFDGYHLLCDLADLPNLALRSASHWLHALRRCVLRMPGEAPIVPLPGETPWLWAYAPAALAMRWSVALGMGWWLASVSSVLGALAALYFGWTLVGQPLRALGRWLTGWSLAPAERRRAGWSIATLALCVLGPALAVPLPDAALAQGVLWPPEDALVRTQTAGFVDTVLVTEGQAVQRGDPLLRLAAPTLLAERERLASRIESLQADRFQALRQDKAQLAAVDHALQAAEAERAQTEEQIAGLTVRAQAGGRVHLSTQAVGDRVRFSVSDTGLGMSPQQLSQLYEPFNRLGREHSGVPGTGIGLVICQRLVALMGGTLNVQSTEGRGSEFWFELPLVGLRP